STAPISQSLTINYHAPQTVTNPARKENNHNLNRSKGNYKVRKETKTGTKGTSGRRRVCGGGRSNSIGRPGWRKTCSGGQDVFGEAKDLVPGPPEGGANPDIVRPREMELVCVALGWAVEDSVLEGLVGLLAEGASFGGVSVIPGGVSSQVAFP